MRKFMVGLARFLPLCAVILLLPAVAASQSPLAEKSTLNLSLWISIVALVISVATAWLSLRISESQIDDNIINSTDSLLALLEKAKTLQ